MMSKTPPNHLGRRTSFYQRLAYIQNNPCWSQREYYSKEAIVIWIIGYRRGLTITRGSGRAEYFLGDMEGYTQNLKTQNQRVLFFKREELRYRKTIW